MGDEKESSGVSPMLAQTTGRMEYHCVTFSKALSFSNFQSFYLYHKGTKSCFTEFHYGVRETVGGVSKEKFNILIYICSSLVN